MMCYKADNIIISRPAQARQNESIVLTCHFDATRYVWNRPWTERKVETHGNTLSIKRVSKNKEGWYYCSTNSNEIIPWHFTYRIGPPVFTVHMKVLLRSRVYINIIGK